MKIDIYTQQEKDYKNKAEEARIEMASAIFERDKILNEIKDQRKGKNEVSSILSTKQNEKESLIFLLEILNIDFEKNKKLFYELTDKQKETLNKINSEINNKKILNKNLSEEINKNANIDLELKNKIQQKKELKREIEQLINFKTDLEIENNMIEKKQKEIEIENKKINEELINREKRLNLSEKRLLKLKKDLLSNK